MLQDGSSGEFHHGDFWHIFLLQKLSTKNPKNKKKWQPHHHMKA
jgi:hypothetical protein